MPTGYCHPLHVLQFAPWQHLEDVLAQARAAACVAVTVRPLPGPSQQSLHAEPQPERLVA